MSVYIVHVLLFVHKTFTTHFYFTDKSELPCAVLTFLLALLGHCIVKTKWYTNVCLLTEKYTLEMFRCALIAVTKRGNVSFLLPAERVWCAAPQ